MTGRERGDPLAACEDDRRLEERPDHRRGGGAEQHGYPPVRDGLDLTELVEALYRFPHVGGAR